MLFIHFDQQESDHNEENKEYQKGGYQVNIVPCNFIYELSEHTLYRLLVSQFIVSHLAAELSISRFTNFNISAQALQISDNGYYFAVAFYLDIIAG